MLDTGIADLCVAQLCLPSEGQASRLTSLTSFFRSWVTGSNQAGFPAVDRFYDAKASSTFTKSVLCAQTTAAPPAEQPVPSSSLTAGYSTSFAEVSPLDGSSAPRVNGYVATDTVRLGGANASDCWLGVMRNSSVGGRPSAPISGQLGLGLGPQTAESAAGYNVSTPAWWEALAANWSAPMFGLRLVQFAANKETLRAGRILRVAEKGGVANLYVAVSSLAEDLCSPLCFHSLASVALSTAQCTRATSIGSTSRPGVHAGKSRSTDWRSMASTSPSIGAHRRARAQSRGRPSTRASGPSTSLSGSPTRSGRLSLDPRCTR